MPDDTRCKTCGWPLMSETEFRDRLCDDCADSSYEQSKERRDFDYWHEGEPP